MSDPDTAARPGGPPTGPLGAPTVSVLVASYNLEAYLPTALRSALHQSLADIEVIVVDDVSADRSAAIALEHAAADRRLRVIRLAERSGAARARSVALEAARGRWIAVLDGDDWMEPDRLAKLVEAAERHGADWIADDQWIEVEGLPWPAARLLLDEPPGASRLDLARLLDRDPPETIGYGTLKPMIRRAFLERHGLRWRADAGRSDDIVLAVSCLLAGATAWLLAEPLYHYRLRPGSQVTSLGPLATHAHMAEIQALIEELVGPEPPPEIARALARRRQRIEAAGAYRCLLAALGAGELGAAGRQIARDPVLLARLASGLADAAFRRLSGRRVPTLANRRLFQTVGR